MHFYSDYFLSTDKDPINPKKTQVMFPTDNYRVTASVITTPNMYKVHQISEIQYSIVLAYFMSLPPITRVKSSIDFKTGIKRTDDEKNASISTLKLKKGYVQ